MNLTDAQQGIARDILEHGYTIRTGQAGDGIQEMADMGLVEFQQYPESWVGSGEIGVRYIVWEAGEQKPVVGYLVDSHNKVVEEMLWRPPRWAIPYGLHWVAAHPDASDPQ